jgi:hypothetical protein
MSLFPHSFAILAHVSAMRKSLLAIGIAAAAGCSDSAAPPVVSSPTSLYQTPSSPGSRPTPFFTIVSLNPAPGSTIRTRTGCADERVCTEPVSFTFSVVSPPFDMPDAELQVRLGTAERWCAVGSTRRSLFATQPVEVSFDVLYLTDATTRQLLGEPCQLPVTTSRIEWQGSAPNRGFTQATFPGPTYTFAAP